MQLERGCGEKRRALRQRELETLHADRIGRLLAAFAARLRRVAARALERGAERGEAVDGRPPLRDVGIGIDEPRQRRAHVEERRRALEDEAEADAAREVARGRDEIRKRDGELQVELGEPVEILALVHDAEPVAHHVLEALAEIGELERLALVERDAFAVLAQAHERIAVVGLVALLVEVEADQRAADAVREQAADERVRDGDPHHEAGNRRAEEREALRQVPQDHDEPCERDHGRKQPDAELERLVDEEAQILGDALVRIVDAAVGELQPVIGAVAKPLGEEVLVEPGTPLDLQHLLQVDPVDAGDDPEHGDDGEAQELREEPGLVLLLQRVVKILVPEVELHLERHDGDRQPDHRGKQCEAFPALRRNPIRLRQCPECAPESR